MKSASDAKKEMVELLTNNHENDIRRMTTSMGMHRDDLKLLLNDIDVRNQGSQGQKRTTALSLKLSEIEIMKNTPVKLLSYFWMMYFQNWIICVKSIC